MSILFSFSKANYNQIVSVKEQEHSDVDTLQILFSWKSEAEKQALLLTKNLKNFCIDFIEQGTTKRLTLSYHSQKPHIWRLTVDTDINNVDSTVFLLLDPVHTRSLQNKEKLTSVEGSKMFTSEELSYDALVARLIIGTRLREFLFNNNFLFKKIDREESRVSNSGVNTNTLDVLQRAFVNRAINTDDETLSFDELSCLIRCYDMCSDSELDDQFLDEVKNGLLQKNYPELLLQSSSEIKAKISNMEQYINTINNKDLFTYKKDEKRYKNQIDDKVFSIMLWMANGSVAGIFFVVILGLALAAAGLSLHFPVACAILAAFAGIAGLIEYRKIRNIEKNILPKIEEKIAACKQDMNTAKDSLAKMMVEWHDTSEQSKVQASLDGKKEDGVSVNLVSQGVRSAEALATNGIFASGQATETAPSDLKVEKERNPVNNNAL